MFGGLLGWLEDAAEDSAKDAARARLHRLAGLAAAAAPAVAVAAAPAVVPVEDTAAGAWCRRGAGLVGPLPKLAKLISAALGVLDIITVEALNVAPPATSCV